MATVFEVSGELAMFRRPYTTTSSVSHQYPPPSALAGMIGAILGFNKHSFEASWNAMYWDHMSGTKVALRIMNPIAWLCMALNFCNTKDLRYIHSTKTHTQIQHQFIHKPRYRIFVAGELEEKLDWHLRHEKYIYTPYLGVAYALCNIKYIGRFETKPCNSFPVVVNTVIPYAEGLQIDMRKSEDIGEEKITYRISNNRLQFQFCRAFHTVKGIHVTDPGNACIEQCGEDVVAWFPKW